VRYRAEHRFGAAPDEVIAVLVDPAFHLALRLPDLTAPEVLDHRSEGSQVLLRLRYEFVGQLDAIGRRLLGGRRLRWLQELHVDRSARTGRLTFAAEGAPERLHGAATFTLAPDGDETVRRLEGELVVDVPLVGGMAERRIVPGLLRRLDIEAQALDDRLRA
jgi:hypothetical protein